MPISDGGEINLVCKIEEIALLYSVVTAKSR